MMRILILGGAALLVLAAGCAKVTLPETVDVGTYGGAPPPATIAPADRNNPVDVRRENAQLRERNAYLEDQSRRLNRKYDDLGKDINEIQTDMSKIASERDRYKQEAGR